MENCRRMLWKYLTSQNLLLTNSLPICIHEHRFSSLICFTSSFNGDDNLKEEFHSPLRCWWKLSSSRNVWKKNPTSLLLSKLFQNVHFLWWWGLAQRVPPQWQVALEIAHSPGVLFPVIIARSNMTFYINEHVLIIFVPLKKIDTFLHENPHHKRKGSPMRDKGLSAEFISTDTKHMELARIW